MTEQMSFLPSTHYLLAFDRELNLPLSCLFSKLSWVSLNFLTTIPSLDQPKFGQRSHANI